MIEVKDLLTQVEIFQGGRAALADFERVLIIGDWCALLRRQDRHLRTSGLVDFPSFSAQRVSLALIFSCFH